MEFSDIKKVLKTKDLDNRELARVIRQSISAEQDAVHLYELIADSADDVVAKKIFQDIANEEKVHIGEFNELLKLFDLTENDFADEGEDEAKELIDESAKEKISKKIKVIKKANVNFVERPDYIRFETQDDIIEITPSSWLLKITEKDTGDEYSGDYETRKEAREALVQEIRTLKNENGE